MARATNDRPAVMLQPSDSYTCSTIPLEAVHRLHVIVDFSASTAEPGPSRPKCPLQSVADGHFNGIYIGILQVCVEGVTFLKLHPQSGCIGVDSPVFF